MDQNKKRYILANIKIPIEINDDYTFETLPDYMTIIFDNINSLPDHSENDYNNEYIKNKIKMLLKDDNNTLFSNEPDPNSEPEKETIISIPTKEIIEKTPIITHDELRTRGHRIHKKNITFKNKKSAGTRYTAKNYSILQKLEHDIYGKG
jgi:hypothetical protein